MMNQPDAGQLRQLEEIKRQMLAKVLEKDAAERLGRVRMADPHLAVQVEMYLIQLSQSGKLQERVTDARLREVLVILSEKKGFTIRRK